MHLDVESLVAVEIETPAGVGNEREPTLGAPQPDITPMRPVLEADRAEATLWAAEKWARSTDLPTTMFDADRVAIRVAPASAAYEDGRIGAQWSFTPQPDRGTAHTAAAGVVETLREERPVEPADIVDQPDPGPGRIDGGCPGRVLHRSPLTSLLGVPRRPVELLTTAAGRLHRGPR